MSKTPPQQDMEGIVNALLKHIKQQPVSKDIKQPNWVERRFGVPQSGEEVLWRIAWLVAIPAIITSLLIPIAIWVWLNLMPMVVIIAIAAGLFIYWLIYQFAVSHSGNLQTLVEIQFCIPVWIAFLVVAWEFLK